MKLVFLSHDGQCNGGAQKCLLDLLRGIRQVYPKVQLYVIFPYEGDLINTCLPYIDGYKVITLPWWLLPGDKRISLKQKIKFIKKGINPIRKIIHYLLEIKPDYGITNTVVIPYLSVACKLLRIRHHWFIHEIPLDTWNDNKFIFAGRTVWRIVDLLSYKIFVTSNYAKRYYQHTMSERKIEVVDQAVELNVSNLSCVTPHQRYTVLLVGAFDSNKGHMELLQAVNRIVKEGKDIYCYLIGADLGFMPACKEYVNVHNLTSNVSIIPFVAEVWRYYYLSDVLVVCSALETFGRVTVEAQKCGLPVILSNVGANPERITNNVNGLLYQKGNLSDLVDKIETLREAKTRQSFVDNITLLNLKKYSASEFASHFMKGL